MPAARLLLVSLAAALAFLASGGNAFAGGGNYVFEGGSLEAQAQVRAALDRSAFDWDIVPGPVTIRITNCGCAGSKPGEIVLDELELTSSPLGRRYAWGVVQHEYAHQVDYFVLSHTAREWFTRRFGGGAWCYEVRGLAHDDYSCERFATLVAWAYWRSPENVQRPDWRPAGAPRIRRYRVRSFVARLLTAAR
jgi:hypothetical protein